MEYDVRTTQMALQVIAMMRVSNVIDEIKTIYYGNDDLRKSVYKKLLFLATDPNATHWVEDAFAEWKYNPLFGDDGHFCSLDKLLIVKAFREVRNLKRKQNDSIPVTADDVVAKIAEWVPTDIWNKTHSKREG